MISSGHSVFTESVRKKKIKIDKIVSFYIKKINHGRANRFYEWQNK